MGLRKEISRNQSQKIPNLVAVSTLFYAPYFDMLSKLKHQVAHPTGSCKDYSKLGKSLTILQFQIQELHFQLCRQLDDLENHSLTIYSLTCYTQLRHETCLLYVCKYLAKCLQYIWYILGKYLGYIMGVPQRSLPHFSFLAGFFKGYRISRA